MKKLILIPVLLCILMLNVQCSSSDDDNSANPGPLINLAMQGTWRVTSFVDSGNDETSDFTNYNFTFITNTVTATNGTNTYTGTWSVTSDDNDDDDDDNSNDDLDFNIAFSAPADFAELTEDWDVVAYSSTTIALVHVSGGGGGTDALVLTKN